ncbi:hypothetical protein HYT52_03470, partial [Candidatus Woesearchaeota archaeon]|nr:hypothetical protein [Candidatus Woesearchaeota archaeon]
MDLEAVLELGPEDKWDFSIDVDRIPKELLERTGPEIPAVLHVPEGYTLPNSSQRIKGYLSLFAYACLSLAVHGVILKTIDSPIPFFHSVKTEEHQQDLLKEYLENHVSKTVREQISSEAKESGDITETIKELLDHYQTQKKELVETTAKDLRDGKLDDIKLAEFVLTLQTLRRNIYYLEKDDYPLEKLSDPQAISSEFQGKAREARVLGTSCDLESLVQLHSFVFNKVINTGYNPNRDSVLSALEGMSQCESGTEGFVLFEDEVSACSDVGLILFGNHQRIGVVHGREGYVLAAEPGAPLLKYTEGKFVPKAVMAAQYLVDEGVSLETFPESIQRYFRDDPSLDKANDVTLAKRGETITEEPWAKKASIPTRANFREGEDSLKIQYWDITPKLAERRGVNPSKEQLSDREVELLQQIQEARDDLQKKKEQVTQIHLEDCVKQAGFEYAAQKARDDGFLRVLPRGITYDEILTFGFNSEDRPELWHLKKIADQAGYALMSAFQKESVRGVEVLSGLTGLTELSAMPGAERETLEMAQKIVDYAKEVDSAKKRDPSLKLTYDITPISEEVFGIIASTHLPEAAVYLEQQVKEYLGKKDSVAIYAFNARINMTSSSG